MNDKEIIKKLAEGIKDTYISHHSECCIHCNIYDDDGTFIRDNFGFYHNLDCPVLLAEEILKEENKCSNCNGTGNENKEDGTDNYCTCNHCGGQETIESVKGTEPYSEDYLMCNKCDSTFNKDEVIKEHFKRIYALAQEYKEEFLHAINYEQYNLSSKADNPQFTEEWFNNIMIDCSICEYMTPHNYLLLINKMKEKGYIISSKPEEPIIIHNVMSYKGKNYLKQLSLQWDPSNIDSCKFCSFNEDCPPIDMACEDNFIWKSFDDIRITDELACMRKDIGDIYLYNIQENKIDKLTYVEDGRKSYVHTIGWRSTNDNMRLATAEEIQKYLEDKK